MKLDMTPGAVMVGSFLVYTVVVVGVVFFPLMEYSIEVEPTPEFAEPRTPREESGRQIYIQNGCQYCHSQYVRPQDQGFGHSRVAQAGDYFHDAPPLLGSERQGPELSQAGGLRSDGWHWAHFKNPRHTRPDSIMPPFDWLSDRDLEDLTIYVQGLGGADGDARTARQRLWRDEAYAAYQAGPDVNTHWLHAHVPDQWMSMPNPYPATESSVDEGRYVYLHYCIGCHGPVGDGMGPAGIDIIARNQALAGGENEAGLAPEAPPYNFTYLARWDGPLGGMIYYQVMNGITGTSMPVFKHELESEKIWNVANYLATQFVGQYGIGEIEPGPRAIPAAYEPSRPDEFEPIPLDQVIADMPPPMEGRFPRRRYDEQSPLSEEDE